MLALINDNRSLIESHDYSFVATSPMVYQCHHFNLLFDQTIDDALGAERGIAVRTQAAYEASSQLLNALVSALPPTTPEERLHVAAAVFATMGQGSLEFQVTDAGGKAIGYNLHYGLAWREKYGGRLRRKHPADAVAAGYIAAATEVAFGLPLGSVQCKELACMATGPYDRCEFQIEPSGETSTAFGVTREDIAGSMPKSFKAPNEEWISKIAHDVREFIAGLGGDRRGLLDSFGIFLTHHLANYYNQCTGQAFEILGAERPDALDVARDLLRECGQVGGFHTFGGLLQSPEWQAMVGRVSGDPLEIVNACLAIGRALGFGHWSLESFEQDSTLILRSPSTYESMYRRVTHPLEEEGSCHVFQGSSLAMMLLAHRVPWADKPELTPSFYAEVRRNMPWKVEETHCVAAGNSICRVVIERA